MDAASLLTGLLLGALLATAVTLGVVTLSARRRPEETGLEPVHESLDHLHRLLAGMERARATAHGELREQMGTVGQTSAQLKHETAALVTALRTPHVRGRWGEVQLRRVVEVAGLLEHCDFVEQPSGVNDQGAGVRPDLVVTLADGRQVIVDAKVPFTGYIEAVQATDQAVRDQRVQLHARQLRTHVDALAARRYPTAFRPAAPFTVLFVPSDGFLTTALEAEPGLLEYGFARDVVLATPSTLLALLRTVAYSWRQERLARDADQVLEVGRLLHARLSTLSGPPDPAGLGARRDHDALQRDGRLLRALGADRGPPVRRPGRRRDPRPGAPGPGGDGAHAAAGRAAPRHGTTADEEAPSRDGTTG